LRSIPEPTSGELAKKATNPFGDLGETLFVDVFADFFFRFAITLQCRPVDPV
jgi:hypothetical protein